MSPRPKPRAAVRTDDENLHVIIRNLFEHRRTVKELEPLISEEQREAMDLMDAQGITSDKTADGLGFVKVSPQQLVLIERQLKKRLGATVWNKITKRVLDRQALEAAIADGIVDPGVVAQCSEEVPKGRPYVRVTPKGAGKGVGAVLKARPVALRGASGQRRPVRKASDRRAKGGGWKDPKGGPDF